MPRSTFGLLDKSNIGLDEKSSQHIGKLSVSVLTNFVNNGGLSPHPMVLKSSSIRTKGESGLSLTTLKLGPDVVTILQRTDALLRGLLLVLQHHDAKEGVLSVLSEQIHSYLDNATSEQVWLKRCKHLLCYPLAKYLRNPLPPQPDTAFRPSGKLRSWMKARLNAFNNKNTHLWYSWFQAKRSTLPLSDDVVSDTYDTHLATLTKNDPVSFLESEDGSKKCENKYLDDIFGDPVFQHVLSLIRTEITQEFNKNSSIIQNRCNPFDELPKTSACFEHTRGNGGQVESLRSEAGLNERGTRQTVVSPEFDSMFYTPKVFTREGCSFNKTIIKQTSYGFHEWQNLKEKSSRLDTSQPLQCTIQAVLEPNKIRVISKGNSLPYYSCKRLQRIMHTSMRKMNCFALIGRPLMDSDIERISRRSKPTDLWCSVDYSAATDGLSYSYSNRILQNLICNLEEHERELASRVLGLHELYYPDLLNSENKEPVHRGSQTNGQLMGSILSFPILCLANLGVYLRSTIKLRKNLKFKEQILCLDDVLINGDDMVYAASQHIFDKNVIIGKSLGLEMSVGKAYFHKSYLNINSQSVICPLDTDRRITRINFLNTGLFFGLHKVQGKTENKLDVAQEHTKTKEGIVANINCLLSGSLPGKSCELLKKSLEFNREKIQQECKGKTFRGSTHIRNLFIKESLGGMGVCPPDGWKYKVTKNDLYIANGFISRYPDLLYTLELPTPGPPPEDLSDFKERPWCPRDTKSDDELTRLPCKQISYKGLRTICRSKVFEFYTINKNHFIFNLQRENKSSKPICIGQKRSYDLGFDYFNDLLTKALEETQDYRLYNIKDFKDHTLLPFEDVMGQPSVVPSSSS